MGGENRVIRASGIKKEKSTDIGKPAVAVKPERLYNSNDKKVRVQSLISAHLKHEGLVTGELYEWPQAGHITLVHEDDVPALLARRVNRKPCCGADKVGNVFQLVTD